MNLRSGSELAFLHSASNTGLICSCGRYGRAISCRPQRSECQHSIVSDGKWLHVSVIAEVANLARGGPPLSPPVHQKSIHPRFQIPCLFHVLCSFLFLVSTPPPAKYSGAGSVTQRQLSHRSVTFTTSFDSRTFSLQDVLTTRDVLVKNGDILTGEILITGHFDCGMF